MNYTAECPFCDGYGGEEEMEGNHQIFNPCYYCSATGKIPLEHLKDALEEKHYRAIDDAEHNEYIRRLYDESDIGYNGEDEPINFAMRIQWFFKYTLGKFYYNLLYKIKIWREKPHFYSQEYDPFADE